jgi:hypothetical protein
MFRAFSRASMLVGKKFAAVLLALVGCEVEKREHHLAASAPLSQADASAGSGAGSQAVSLALTGASAFIVKVEGCASGYFATLTEQTPAVSLYTGDHGCLGKLEELTVSGTTYQPLSGSTFKTWKVGDQAVYVNSATGQTLNVAVARQLSDPLAAADAIDFRISRSEADATTRQILDLSYGPSGQAFRPGDIPPSFIIRQAKAIGVDPATDAVYYSFIFECAAGLLVPSKDARKSTCDGIKLQSIDYDLVEDTFGDAPCTSVDLAPCNEILRIRKTSLDPAFDILLPGSSEAPNGGFTTKTALSSALKTVADLPSHPHMLLLIRAPGPTYQYFNLDVSVAKTY